MFCAKCLNFEFNTKHCFTRRTMLTTILNRTFSFFNFLIIHLNRVFSRFSRFSYITKTFNDYMRWILKFGTSHTFQVIRFSSLWQTVYSNSFVLWESALFIWHTHTFTFAVLDFFFFCIFICHHSLNTFSAMCLQCTINFTHFTHMDHEYFSIFEIFFLNLLTFQSNKVADKINLLMTVQTHSRGWIVTS